MFLIIALFKTKTYYEVPGQKCSAANLLKKFKMREVTYDMKKYLPITLFQKYKIEIKRCLNWNSKDYQTSMLWLELCQLLIGKLVQIILKKISYMDQRAKEGCERL